MQGMVAGKRSRGKPIQRWEKYITDTFGPMAAASRVAGTGINFAETSGQRRPDEEMLREEEEIMVLVLVFGSLNYNRDPYTKPNYCSNHNLIPTQN